MLFSVIFPGQGCQKIGMLLNFYKVYPVIKTVFEEASNAIDIDLWDLIQEGPKKILNMTKNTQPALLTSSIAIWKIWKKLGGKNPYIIAGHSLGEYTSLVCSGVLKFSDAVRISRIRGEIMQKVSGKMVSISGINSKFIEQICTKSFYKNKVFPANYNSYNQTVISGYPFFIQKIKNYFQKKFCKTYILPVSIPAHCALMKKSSKKFKKILKKNFFSKPKINILNNVNAKIERCPLRIRKALIRQMYSPVKWTKTIEYLIKKKIRICLEMGPGNVLTNLNKYIGNTISSVSLDNPKSMHRVLKKYF